MITPSPFASEQEAPPRIDDGELASMVIDAEVNNGTDFINPDDGARAVLDLRDARAQRDADKATIAELRKEIESWKAVLHEAGRVPAMTGAK